MKKGKLNSFQRQFMAALNGDSDGVKSEKAWRQADGAINSQIYALKGKTVGLENSVDRAKEALVKARVNGGELIENENTYINNLFDAQNSVLLAEKELKRHNAKLEFLQSEIKALSEETED